MRFSASFANLFIVSIVFFRLLSLQHIFLSRPPWSQNRSGRRRCSIFVPILSFTVSLLISIFLRLSVFISRRITINVSILISVLFRLVTWTPFRIAVYTRRLLWPPVNYFLISFIFLKSISGTILLLVRIW